MENSLGKSLSKFQTEFGSIVSISKQSKLPNFTKSRLNFSKKYFLNKKFPIFVPKVTYVMLACKKIIKNIIYIFFSLMWYRIEYLQCLTIMRTEKPIRK